MQLTESAKAQVRSLLAENGAKVLRITARPG